MRAPAETRVALEPGLPLDYRGSGVCATRTP